MYMKDNNNPVLFYLPIAARVLEVSIARTLARRLQRPFTSPIAMTPTPLTTLEINQATSTNKWPRRESDCSHPYRRH